MVEVALTAAAEAVSPCRPYTPVMPQGSNARAAKTPTARHAATLAIRRAAESFPDAPPVSLDIYGLSAQDTSLSLAIHRTTLQRWLTLEHLIDRYAKTPVHKMEPGMQAVLLVGAAQLVFMRGLASYAVVDESVKLAAQFVRPEAKGMVNAVLRRVAGLVKEETAEPWTPMRDRLPGETGSITLNEPALPHPANLVKHLPAATSFLEGVVSHWLKRHGAEVTTRLCVHSLQTPPTIVQVEDDALRQQEDERWLPHASERALVWRGSRDALVEFLAADRRRRVQDPASFAAGSAAAGLRPKTILDYCAGLGTKTRQLALQHPDAQITATDVNDERRATLRDVPQAFPNVRVVEPDAARRQRCDLLLLDVPCSNSGVLARRPEAKYRMSGDTVAQLVELQRQILGETLPLVNPGGHVLYTSCSIEKEENEYQARWIVERTGGTLVSEAATLPAGQGDTYHDGSYHALIKMP